MAIHSIHHRNTVSSFRRVRPLLICGESSASVNPSKLIINHWTNGDEGFTQGPPERDATMKGEYRIMRRRD